MDITTDELFIEALKKENEKLRKRCIRLIILLTECLNYIDNNEHFNEIIKKLDEIKKNN